MAEINPIQFSTTDASTLNGASSTQSAKPSIFTGNMSTDDTASSSSTKKSQKFNSDGTVTTSYDYDGDGNIDMEVVRDANGEQKEVIEYSYGYRTYEDGTKVPVKKAEYEYWDNGKCIGDARASFIDNKEADREEFAYDNRHDNTSYTKYENGKLVLRCEYSYQYEDGYELDQNKNLVKVPNQISLMKEERIYDENNKLVTIIEHEYEHGQNKFGEDMIVAETEKETDVETGKVTVTRYDENNPKVLKGTVELGH